MAHEIEITVKSQTHAEAMREIMQRATTYFGTHEFVILGTEAEGHFDDNVARPVAWDVTARVVLHAHASDAAAWLDNEVGK